MDPSITATRAAAFPNANSVLSLQKTQFVVRVNIDSIGFFTDTNILRMVARILEQAAICDGCGQISGSKPVVVLSQHIGNIPCSVNGDHEVAAGRRRCDLIFAEKVTLRF
jgi:hypothetical protein